ncbi:MAG: lipocalin-like domain-containing protein [Steroidobacteraceae bacterium]
MRSTRAMPFCALLLGSMSSVAQQHPTCAGPQLGTWILLSMETEDLQSGQKHNLLGVHPSGYLSYGPDCRMSAILVKESREGPAALVPTDPESIELYRGLIAYAGSYAIDGYTITHHIEASWNQGWTGTTQVSQFNIDGKSLYIRTGPSKSPITGRQSSTVFIWARVE